MLKIALTTLLLCVILTLTLIPLYVYYLLYKKYNIGSLKKFIELVYFNSWRR